MIDPNILNELVRLIAQEVVSHLVKEGLSKARLKQAARRKRKRQK